jgi:hypothetical protein
MTPKRRSAPHHQLTLRSPPPVWRKSSRLNRRTRVKPEFLRHNTHTHTQHTHTHTLSLSRSLSLTPSHAFSVSQSHTSPSCPTPRARSYLSLPCPLHRKNIKHSVTNQLYCPRFGDNIDALNLSSTWSVLLWFRRIMSDFCDQLGWRPPAEFRLLLAFHCDRFTEGKVHPKLSLTVVCQAEGEFFGRARAA